MPEVMVRLPSEGDRGFRPLQLVVTRRVQNELSDQLTVLGKKPNPEIVDQHEDPRAGEPPRQPDAVQP
jgi:hypothetical protein